jgi:hypothetical protein
MPIVEGGAPVPYGDTTTPKRFGTVSPLDPQLFSSVEEHAGELLNQTRSGKYSPLEVAQFFDDSATAAGKAIEQAAASVPSRKDAGFRRVEEDVLIQIALGRFYADKLRAGVLFDLYRRTGNPKAHEQALAAYRKARETWATMAERARGVYVADLTYGETPVRRGHWMDRLPAIDQDLSTMEKAHFDAQSEPAEHVDQAIAKAAKGESRVVFNCGHNSPRGFVPGKAVALALSVQGAAPASTRLYYRQVNQAERWKSVEMEREGRSFQASIPAAYTQSPFALEYYFELRQTPTSATLYPGFNAQFTNQPYFVLMKS